VKLVRMGTVPCLLGPSSSVITVNAHVLGIVFLVLMRTFVDFSLLLNIVEFIMIKLVFIV